MTRLALLDAPATAAISDRLIDVYRAAMGAAPFHETEVETGWFADELTGEVAEPASAAGRPTTTTASWPSSPMAGFPTPEVPADGWYGSLREAVGPDAAERWLTGQFAVVWIAVHPDWRGCGSRHLQPGPGSSHL